MSAIILQPVTQVETDGNAGCDQRNPGDHFDFRAVDNNVPRLTRGVVQQQRQLDLVKFTRVIIF